MTDTSDLIRLAESAMSCNNTEGAVRKLIEIIREMHEQKKCIDNEKNGTYCNCECNRSHTQHALEETREGENQ